MQYLQIKGWTKMQQYKDRDPKWIKLDRELLDNYAFCMLDDAAKFHVIGLRLLAAKMGNKIPNDTDWIRDKISSLSDVEIQPLIDAGFIEYYDGTESCVQICTELYIEKRRTEKSKEKKSDKPTTFPPNLNNPAFIKAWEEWVQFRKEIKKKLTPSTISKQLKLLSKKPKLAIATIERSIQNGWQGLFPEQASEGTAKPDPLKAKFMQENPEFKEVV